MKLSKKFRNYYAEYEITYHLTHGAFPSKADWPLKEPAELNFWRTRAAIKKNELIPVSTMKDIGAAISEISSYYNISPYDVTDTTIVNSHPEPHDEIEPRNIVVSKDLKVEFFKASNIAEWLHKNTAWSVNGGAMEQNWTEKDSQKAKLWDGVDKLSEKDAACLCMGLWPDETDDYKYGDYDCHLVERLILQEHQKGSLKNHGYWSSGGYGNDYKFARKDIIAFAKSQGMFPPTLFPEKRPTPTASQTTRVNADKAFAQAITFQTKYCYEKKRIALEELNVWHCEEIDKINAAHKIDEKELIKRWSGLGRSGNPKGKQEFDELEKERLNKIDRLKGKVKLENEKIMLDYDKCIRDLQAKRPFDDKPTKHDIEVNTNKAAMKTEILPESQKETGEANVFRKNGDYWKVTFKGQSATVKHRDGMTYIHWLLQNPKKPFLASELLQLKGGGEPKTISREDLKDLEAGAISDGHQIQHGSRSARQAVSHAVNRAITNIRDSLPELAEYLKDRKTISLGRYIQYKPIDETAFLTK